MQQDRPRKYVFILFDLPLNATLSDVHEHICQAIGVPKWNKGIGRVVIKRQGGDNPAAVASKARITLLNAEHLRLVSERLHHFEFSRGDGNFSFGLAKHEKLVLKDYKTMFDLIILVD